MNLKMQYFHVDCSNHSSLFLAGSSCVMHRCSNEKISAFVYVYPSGETEHSACVLCSYQRINSCTAPALWKVFSPEASSMKFKGLVCPNGGIILCVYVCMYEFNL